MTMRNSLATWNWYTDFPKVHSNVDKLKNELGYLNSLIGSPNIECEFRNVISQHPDALKAIPILLAKRERRIVITDAGHTCEYDFNKMNQPMDDYVLFMRNTGLFDLLQNHISGSIVDYATGIEAGMDTNGRKNRTGDAMEDLVESYLAKAGLAKDVNYFKEMYKSEVESKFNIDLSSISNQDKTEKRFDFVFTGASNVICALECNFYSSSGSKLNETARSYKTLAVESKDIDNFKFVWITDGGGWSTAKHNLEETFDVLDDLYNIQDMENGAIQELIK